MTPFVKLSEVQGAGITPEYSEGSPGNSNAY